MNKNVVIGALIIIVALGFGGWYWYTNLYNGSPLNGYGGDEVMVQPTTVPTESASMDVVETKEITVEGGQFKFTPNEIKVKLGDKVKVTFKNVEGFHDFVIDEFSAKTAQIAAGKEETIEFTADKVGTFEYYCSVGKHRQMGMVGKLIVE